MTEIVGLEAANGVVVPVSLVCRSPNVVGTGGGLLRVLVRENSGTGSTVRGQPNNNATDGFQPVGEGNGNDTGIGNGNLRTHEDRVGKIVEFARILHGHDYLSAKDVAQIRDVLQGHPDVTWVVCNNYWAEPDAGRLLHTLRHIAASTPDEIATARDIIEVTNLLAGGDGAGFELESIRNLFYLILTRDQRVLNAFQVCFVRRHFTIAFDTGVSIEIRP